MCTLVIDLDPKRSVPLIIGANRDEQLTRPSEPPSLWQQGPIPFLAPRDLQAHGTWLGLNARGLFVGVTNRAGGPPDPSRDSRGALVVEALAHPDAATAQAALAALAPDRFNPFHLLCADVNGAYVTWSDGQALHQYALGPGVHAISERSHSPAAVARVQTILEAWPRTGTPGVDRIQSLLGLHGSPERPFEAPCVHVQGFDYGTRSSTVLLLDREPARSRWRWAEGPPCRAPFVDLAPLLATLPPMVHPPQSPA